MKFFRLRPEVAGEWGKRTIADTTVHPPKVSHLHHEFQGWEGDSLLESFPCFIVTPQIAQELGRAKLSGFHLDSVEVTESPQLREFSPDLVLPDFRWLQVDGTPGLDDFGLLDDAQLIVSENALRVLESGQLTHCEVHQWATV